MKRYFVNGKEITAKKAEEVEARNNELMKSTNIADWAECQFIVVIG